MIDKGRDRPAYRQLADELRERIEAGRYQPRRPLPSELHLQQEFGISRDTVRKGVRLLADLGLVRTVAGRGSYVLAVDRTTVLPEPGMRIFSRRANDAERATLGLVEDEWVLVIERPSGVEVFPADSAEVAVGESRGGGAMAPPASNG